MKASLKVHRLLLLNRGYACALTAVLLVVVGLRGLKPHVLDLQARQSLSPLIRSSKDVAEPAVASIAQKDPHAFGSGSHDSDDAAALPRMFHFVWIDVDGWDDNHPQALPPPVFERIQGWPLLNPGWKTTVWTNREVIQHFPSLLPTLRLIKTGAWAADLLRYHILFQHGGIYLDTDIKAMRALPEELLHTQFSVCENPRNYSKDRCLKVCNAVIASMPGSMMMQQAADGALRATQQQLQLQPVKRFDGKDVTYLMGAVDLTGPAFWSTVALAAVKHEGIRVLQAPTFFPCDWGDVSTCNTHTFQNDTNVIGMHLWEHSWG